MGYYIPGSEEDRRAMLSRVGAKNLDALYENVPGSIFRHSLNLPHGLGEMGALGSMQEMSEKNACFSSVFRGAGAYRHYIPAIVKSVTSKEEFVTAYTPYQAEISQGVLQSIFEYQTMICELTGMDVSNASVYDGTTAAAEAVTMCVERKRTVALVSETAHPDIVETIGTYGFAANRDVVTVPSKGGRIDPEALKKLLKDDACCFVMQQPNFFGLIEDAEAVEKIVHEAGAKLVMHVNPISLGLYKTPGEIGADVAVGEGQPLGMPLSFGGPYLGFMAAKSAMTRRLPGRIVGETRDKEGRRAYVLTLQAREQHIRREKASSNICSNQALCAMTAAVYMAAMGFDGIREVARQCHAKAAYLKDAICAVDGFKPAHEGEFFHEFVTAVPIDPEVLADRLAGRGILAGLPVKEGMLWCCTEMNTKRQMDQLVCALKEASK